MGLQVKSGNKPVIVTLRISTSAVSKDGQTGLIKY